MLSLIILLLNVVTKLFLNQIKLSAMTVSRSLSSIVITGVRVYNIGKDITCYVFEYLCSSVVFEREVREF